MMDKLEADVANRILFFDLWFKKGIEESDADRLIRSVSPEYKEYLMHKRLLARYTLTELEEKVMTLLDVTGTNALIKIYDRLTNGFEFIASLSEGRKIIRKKYSNKEKMVSLIRSPRPYEREAAYKSLWQVYKKIVEY
jgi:oligoendopeptidase F